ncbi:OmpA family protein [Mucilaginibacter robiniae]|uniref:OmpA family protein n=1 Tax=Mucilaginibacter robiniae TaxID=2728022 RepID=A0A7L5E2B3_9SPHI|nr:OmpA family protein [Mucilaginibacter robiniae]QJD96557.1 OmpA family protein [Mucilaginibacter robiniae]
MSNQKGVLKIKHAGGKYYPKMGNGTCLVIVANQPNKFEVSEWVTGTKDEDKKAVKWLLEDGRRNKILMQFGNRGPVVSQLSIPPEKCGVYNQYYLEATLTGQIDKSKDTGLLVRGYCPPAIVKSSWSWADGKPVTVANPIYYGDDVKLHIDTVGLCNSELVVNVYSHRWGPDVLVHTYNGVKCTNGQVNLFIRNTFSWFGKMKYATEDNEFYITVTAKEVNGLIKDTTPNGDVYHARYLRVKHKLINTPKVLPSANLSPVKLGANELNIKRYELCGFTRIEVADDQDRVVLFDEGKLRLKGEIHKDFIISEMIHYDFDKSFIRADAKPILNKIGDFLLESPYVPVELGSHTDDRGKPEYNMALSERRAKAAVDYLISKGISANRITAKGYGKTMLLIKGEHLTKEQHEQNRRTTIKFKIFSSDAQSLIYETISPDINLKKKLNITIKDFNVAGCLYKGTPKVHDNKKIKVVSHISAQESKPATSVTMQGEVLPAEIFANLANVEVFPFRYIWPIYNQTNNFLYYVNTCRYFSDKNKPSILVKAYPDIKWIFAFHLNLTNDLSIKGQNLSKDKLKDLQKKAGKIGAERRWEQKEASWKMSLQSEWNKGQKKKLYQTKDYDIKLKKLYDLFASMGNMADAITNRTKGFIRNIGFKNTPVLFEVKPPNLTIDASWYLKRARKAKQAIEKIGTQVEFNISATPLIGLEMTVDLLGLTISAVAGAFSEGAASRPALELYQKIKDMMNKGVDVGDDDFGFKTQADVYIDLVVSGIINLDNINFSFNTVSDGSDTALKLQTTARLKVEIKAGMYVKAQVSLVVVKANGYFEMSAKSSGSVTFGHKLNCVDDGIYYRPVLGFDGLDVEYIIVVKAGISSKKVPSVSKDHTFYEKKGEYRDLIPKFDVIKSFEEVSGISANFMLIKND